MANPLLLPDQFEKFDFALLARKEQNPKNRIRLIAMANIQEGKPLSQIAESLKVHWKTIQTWIANFRKFGINGLYVKATKLKPRKITEAIDKWIYDFIQTLNSKDTGGYITGKQLHALVEQEFSIKCCLRSIYNALHRLNFSWISSRSKHPKSNEEVQLEYKKFSTNT